MSGGAIISFVAVLLICGLVLKFLFGMGATAIKKPLSLKGSLSILALLAIWFYFVPNVTEAMARIP